MQMLCNSVPHIGRSVVTMVVQNLQGIVAFVLLLQVSA